MMDRGTLVDHDGRPAVRFRREYAQPAERLWAAITEPDELERWFPFKVRMQPEAGGTIEFYGDPNLPDSGQTGTILVYEPPKRLVEARDAAARNAAGWTVCLAELGKPLAGQVAGGPHSETAESWREHYEDYVAAGMPSGAYLPSGA